VADWVASGEVKIEYFPTAQFLAYYFTKPLQGNLFLKMRNLIMNVNPASDYTYAMQNYWSVLNMCNGQIRNDHIGHHANIGNNHASHANVQTNRQV
jgi:hypothetical protein